MVVDGNCRIVAVNDSFRALGDRISMAYPPGSPMGVLLDDEQYEVQCGIDTGTQCKVEELSCCIAESPDEDVTDLPESGMSLFRLSTNEPYYLVVSDRLENLPQVGLVRSVAGGVSDISREIFKLVTRAGGFECPILLAGEPGVGKSRLAREIHDMGVRKNGPFVQLSCAGISDEEFERRLFGVEIHTSNGELVEHRGILDSIEGGTLLLGDIGDLSLGQQLKVLHLMESSRYTRCGGIVSRKVDFRLLVTSRDNLRALVESGKFRKDLYYEINVCPVDVPPLRERPEDVPVIVRALLNLAYDLDQAPLVHPDAYVALMSYAYPGNVRELKSIVSSACMFAENGLINPDCLPPRILEATGEVVLEVGSSIDATGIVPLKEVEQQYLEELLREFEGGKKALADHLGISERTLYRRLRKLRNVDSAA